MFGTGVVAQHTYNVLRLRAPIIAALGTPPRIHNLMAAPQGVEFPLALHYAETGTYTGPIAGSAGVEPNEEIVRYVVRFICKGVSDAPIRAAAKDALNALAVDNAEATVTQDGEDFALTLLPVGEWPLTTIIEGGVIYRQLGFYLTAHVFRV